MLKQKFPNLSLLIFSLLVLANMTLMSTSVLADEVAYTEVTDSSTTYPEYAYYLAPTFADANSDGRLEMYIGFYDSDHSSLPHNFILLYEQDSSNPFLFTARTDTSCVADPDDPYDPTDSFAYCDGRLSESYNTIPKPAFADLDDDGLMDLLLGQGVSVYHEEADSTSLGVFNLISTDAIPSDTTESMWAPTIGDLDGDGLFDVVIGNYHGTLSFYEQDSANSTVFTTVCEPVDAEAADPDTGNPAVSAVYCGSATGIDVGTYVIPGNSFPAIGDLDSDGLIDLIIGSYDGDLYHYEQDGTDAYSFVSVAPSSSDPYDPGNLFAMNFGTAATPAIADINGDGILDIAVGSQDGGIRIFKGYHPVCGDGIVSGTSETCDDGNTTDLDGCSASCTTEIAYTYYADADRDRLGSTSSSVTSYSSSPPSGYVNNNADCDDSNARIKGPKTYYQDSDGDAYGSTTVTITACSSTSGYISRGGDCNDTRPRVNPGAAEIVGNSIDDNCDGTTL